MRYCPQCDFLSDDSCNFCPNCGTRMRPCAKQDDSSWHESPQSPPQQRVNTPVYNTTPIANRPPVKKQRKTRPESFWRAVGIAVILLIIILGIQDNRSYRKYKTTADDYVSTYSSSAVSSQKSNSAYATPDNSVTYATMGERNALDKAKSYLEVMPFSYSGLIEQLEYEGYTSAEAQYGADNCGANWNTQAARAAKRYLEVMSFSRSGLIEQLVYEGYTQEEAEYGVTQVGY